MICCATIYGLSRQLTVLTPPGFIVDFIPPPVISGFTSAAAITIATGQIKVGVHVSVLVTVVCVRYMSVE